jgi:steroid 5-alpha reductase family enzyme
MIPTAFSALGVILALMALLWLASLPLRNAGIVDIFWGTGFAVLAWFYFVSSPGGFIPREVLVAGLVTVWGLRLSIHLLLRNFGKPEDFRYAGWREQHGAAWPLRSLFQVFLLQGGILWLVSLPLLAAMQPGGSGWTVFDGLAVAVWLAGFVFEAGGDWQLRRFRADPANRGKLLTAGFWSLTRHPNYFGDALVWWGHFLFALPAGFWTVFSPLLMMWLLRRVSGVAMLERSMRRKPGYEAYARRTPAFFPDLSKVKKIFTTENTEHTEKNIF